MVIKDLLKFILFVMFQPHSKIADKICELVSEGTTQVQKVVQEPL